MNKPFQNIYAVLILRLAIVYLLYFIARCCFYIFNTSIFTDVTAGELWHILIGSFQFDTSAIIYTNIPIILLHLLPFKFRYRQGYQRAIMAIFVVVNSLALIVNMADIVYYRFTLRRTTTLIFNEFSNGELTFSLVMRMLADYWYFTLLTFGLIAAMTWLYTRIKVAKQPFIKRDWLYYSLSSLTMFLGIYLCIGGMRGGFRHSTRPITLSNAANYVTKPLHRAIVLNTPFSLLRTIGNQPLEKVEYFKDTELEEIYTPIHKPDTTPYTNTMADHNIVIIIVESLGRELVGDLNKDIDGYGGYTPFLDSLSQSSYTFTRAFANGRKSIDALPSIISSIPSMVTPFILSPYSGNDINTIPLMLASKGYNSTFMHGAPNGSMGFDAFARQSGFDSYYGKNEHNNDVDFDGIWGIWDEQFLQSTVKQMSTLPTPFFSTIFTLSSHHPFVVPEKYASRFVKESTPLAHVMRYTDYALQQFFESAKRQSWFKNTLFIITADHSSSNVLPRTATSYGNYTIPIIVYSPEGKLPVGRDETIVQQCDIMPLIADLVGYSGAYSSFGNNPFDKNSAHFATNYNDGIYQLIEGDTLLQFDGKQVVGVYNYVTDPLLEHNVPTSNPQMERQLKAIIQQYNTRMIDNKLIP